MGVVAIAGALGFGVARLSARPATAAADHPLVAAPLVTWDGGSFTGAELEGELVQLPAIARAKYQDEAARLEMVESLARTAMLAEQARAYGFDREPEVVRRLRDELAGQFIKRRFEAPLKLEPTSEEIDEFYRSHAERFTQPEELRVAHIVMKDRRAAAGLLADVIKRSATDFYAFSNAAQLKSEDAATKARGGELPATTPERIGEIIGAAGLEVVGKLQPGSIAPQPVEGPEGFHLLKLIDSRPGGKAPIESVREYIAQQLRNEKREAAWKKFTAENDAALGFAVDRDAVRKFSVK